MAERKGKYRKLTHVVYQCNYHIVWVPKYRLRILTGAFWARGYFVKTIGLEEELVRRYVTYQEQQEKQRERDGRDYDLCS